MAVEYDSQRRFPKMLCRLRGVRQAWFLQEFRLNNLNLLVKKGYLCIIGEGSHKVYVKADNKVVTEQKQVDLVRIYGCRQFLPTPAYTSSYTRYMVDIQQEYSRV